MYTKSFPLRCSACSTTFVRQSGGSGISRLGQRSTLGIVPACLALLLHRAYKYGSAASSHALSTRKVIGAHCRLESASCLALQFAACTSTGSGVACVLSSPRLGAPTDPLNLVFPSVDVPWKVEVPRKPLATTSAPGHSQSLTATPRAIKSR